MDEPKPGDPDFSIDVSDRPLPPGTPVNDRGLPIFVMSDAEDLHWPRALNPEDPDRPGHSIHDRDETP